MVFDLTDSGTATPLTAQASLSLYIAAATPISFGTAPAATGTYNVAYSSTVAASGGAGTLIYSLASGSLPHGLSLNTSTGAITGTPTTSASVGTFPFTVTVTDAYGDSATSPTYTIVVSYPAMSVTTTTLPTGYIGSAYAGATLAATGGAGVSSNYAWAKVSGPAGLLISAAGVVSGTPTGSTTGSLSLVVSVTDSVSTLSTQATIPITINPAVSLSSSATLPTGYGGTAYSTTLTATGGSGTGYQWTSSSLPSGFALSAAGVLSATGAVMTSDVTGSPYSFSATVTDSAGNTASPALSLTINPGVSVTVPTIPTFYPGASYAATTFTASGGSGTGYTYSWAAASGSTLPSGLSLATAGAIAGTPANATTSSVTSNLIVTATDSLGNIGTATFSLTIEATLAISTGATLPGSVVNTPYSDTLAATGGSGGYTWSTDSAGTASLAAVGLTLSSGGIVAGATPSLGTANFTATVTDSASHTASRAFSVTVSNLLTVTTTSLPATGVGASYSHTLAAAGGSGTGYAWTATSSNLATYGLSLSSTGVLSGTPTTAGTASFTANVTDSNSATATQPLTITIYSALSLPTPDPISLPSTAYVGVAYNGGNGGTITGSGGSGNLSIAVASGLPSDGLSGSPSGAVLTVSGTPTSATTVTFSVTLTDTTTNISITQSGYDIVVSTPTAVSLPTPNPSSLGSVIVSQSYSGAINASGGVSPFTWTINGNSVGSSGYSLGNGTLAAYSSGGNTLSISGTPTSTGTVTLTNVKVTDAANSSATNTYTITVNPVPTLAVTLNDVPQGMVGMPYSYNGVSVSGGTGPYTITYTNAPAGLSKDSNSNLAGTPTAAATTTVTVNVADSSSTVQTASKPFSLTVVPKTVAAHNSYLSGQYACYFNQYWDGGVTGGTGSTLHRGGGVFAIAVNGSGSITGGEVDHNSPQSGYSSASITGTYAVGSDNRGYLSLTVGSSTSVIFALAGGNLSSSKFSEFAITEMDDAGASPSGQHGGGHCYKQNTATAFTGTLPSGGYVFSLTGEDSSGSPESIVGSVQLTAGTGSGTVTAVQDVVDGATVTAAMSSSGTYTEADSYGRLTMTAGPSGETAHTTVMYLTNNTKGAIVIMGEQSHNGSSDADFIIGEGRKQVAANIAASYPFTGAALLYTEGTNNNSGSTTYKSMVAQFTGSSSAQTITINSEISSNGGTFKQDNSGDLGTATYTVDTTTGRATLNSSSGKGGVYFYLYDTNSAAVILDDGTTPENLVGWIEPQTAPTSGTWAVSNFASSYFMSKIDNGDYNNDFQTSVLSIDSSGTIGGYAEDSGGWNWASWDNGMTGNNGTTETAAIALDATTNGATTDGAYGLFDVNMTEGSTTTTQSYCFAISADAASNSSSTKGKLVCMDASSNSPKLSIIQE
jgi:hypothetical protein